MSVKFCTIASGSGGNSAVLSTDHGGILIDAGLSGKTIENGLAAVGVSPKSLRGIFLTHEHSDHVCGAGVVSRRYDLPLYMTSGTWKAICRYKSIGKIMDKNIAIIDSDELIELGNIKIKPFSIPHDAAEPVGYCIYADGHKISIATDLGHIDDDISQHIYGSEIILLESNHDIEMLRRGPYPEQLKRRILSDIGHLSNVSAGRFLSEVFCGSTKHIFLGHLSEENNHPMLAYETVKNILMANKINVGTDCGLYLANRKLVSPMITLA